MICANNATDHINQLINNEAPANVSFYYTPGRIVSHIDHKAGVTATAEHYTTKQAAHYDKIITEIVGEITSEIFTGRNYPLQSSSQLYSYAGCSISYIPGYVRHCVDHKAGPVDPRVERAAAIMATRMTCSIENFIQAQI